MSDKDTVLQKQYYDHWMLFVCGSRLLYRTEVPYEDTRIALRLFHKFILLTADLYGEENVTYNLHLLQIFNASMYRIQEIVVISHVPSCSFAELSESSLLIGKYVSFTSTAQY